MDNFNRRGKSDYRQRSGRREDRPLYQATCTECGKSCEVPFKPTGNRPVLCRDCFHKGRSDKRPDRRDFGEKKMYSAVCDKCGNRCEVPFRPTGDKPVYCRDCFSARGRPAFGQGGSNGDKSTEHFDQQFSLLNEKLDKILKRLTPSYMREQTTLTDGTVPKKVTKKKISTEVRKRRTK